MRTAAFATSQNPTLTACLLRVGLTSASSFVPISDKSCHHTIYTHTTAQQSSPSLYLKHKYCIDAIGNLLCRLLSLTLAPASVYRVQKVCTLTAAQISCTTSSSPLTHLLRSPCHLVPLQNPQPRQQPPPRPLKRPPMRLDTLRHPLRDLALRVDLRQCGVDVVDRAA